ncbi:hypothetical protein [Novosphingobium sp. AP12]|uniref:hypothetical protein n=1 Tax=Novosphingobium sp. AP12 TaxID=1144305 RepID=UPI000271FBAA|nr:hypothetical protein [Novosphingobium sp. AP12]EJL22851.1 hypothetical protein PMI02_04405 [Novosphingobium sp. AP12]
MTAGVIIIIKSVLAVLTAVLSIVAAALWWRSAVVRVSPENANIEREKHFARHGRTGYAAWTLFDGSDMEFTLKRQSAWSRWAAIAASAAAFCQSLCVATDWIPLSG